MCTLGEHAVLPTFGRVGLHDPDPAQRLTQASSDLGVDLSAFPEQRAQLLERGRHGGAEDGQYRDGVQGQRPIEPEQHTERYEGGEDASGQLHESGADQVPNALRIRHDARDQDTALRGVEEPDRQPRHMRLDGLAHFCDRPLRGDTQDL